MDENPDSLGDPEVLSTIYCNSKYTQVLIDRTEKDKTPFSYNEGLYKFVFMPLWLKNARTTFTRLVESILSRCKWQNVLLYIDDFSVFQNQMEHL